MNNPIVDFHAHAFPDAIAGRAISQLEHGGGVKAFLDGTIVSLLGSMDAAGIRTSVVCSIATKPEQFDPMLKWSKEIASPRIVPLLSVHPKGADPVGQVRRVAEAGLQGIKLHPYYQDFDLDDASVVPLYKAIEELGLFLVCHTGFDFAFPRQRRADPVRILRVLDRVPGLRLITSHMGAWDDWDEVEKHLIGKPVTMDISLSLELLGRERARDMVLSHPADRILFGSDSPWSSQSETLRLFRSLGLGPELEDKILGKNAEMFLAPFSTSIRVP